MTSLRLRLTLTYLLVILIALGVAAPLAWQAAEQLYLDTQQANLLAQAQLVAAALPVDTLTDSPAAPVQPYSQLLNVMPGLHTRLLDPQNAAVIDLSTGTLDPYSPVSLPRLAQNAAGPVSSAELLARPEIIRALAGQPATAIRRVEVAGGRRVLYAAAPVLAKSGQVTRLVYLATPLPETGLTALPPVTRWQLLGVLLGAIALATAVGWGLARQITHPLKALVKAAGAVAAGQLTQTAPEAPHIRELRDLGRAFNAMTASLRQADQLKAAFIADVSHELRTPLTALKGTVETLQDGAVDDLAVRDRFLASLAAETERLIRLVNNLLTLTRADAGALNLQMSQVNLSQLVQARLTHMAGLAAPRQVSLRLAGQPDPFCIWADPDRLAQVLDNLLDNAIRYSPPGGSVTVTLSAANGEVACAVTDAGPGIPAQHLPLIFERFYRADPSRSGSRHNSGLGLAIARALITAQGGRITAASPAGEGATLTVTLPLCP